MIANSVNFFTLNVFTDLTNRFMSVADEQDLCLFLLQPYRRLTRLWRED